METLLILAAWFGLWFLTGAIVSHAQKVNRENGF